MYVFKKPICISVCSGYVAYAFTKVSVYLFSLYLTLDHKTSYKGNFLDILN